VADSAMTRSGSDFHVVEKGRNECVTQFSFGSKPSHEALVSVMFV
jgi:hypothetical protein